VQKTKCALSSEPAAEFHFSDGFIAVNPKVTRAEFEEWIAEDLAKIESCIDSLRRTSGVDASEIDKVFLNRRLFVCPCREAHLRVALRRRPHSIG
jgi:hypothetical chaperone protein